MTDKHKMTAAELRIAQARQDRARSEEAIKKARKDAQNAAREPATESQPEHPVIQTGKGLTDG